MTWKDINVFQWQQLIELFAQKDSGLTELDMDVKAAAIVMDLTEHQIDSLPTAELKSILQQIRFIYQELKPQPVRYIQVKGKRYRCIYDVRQIPAARYIESKYFDTDRVGNLHKLAACMVMPQKRNWLGMWVDDKFDAAKHADYAQDMLSAPITAVLGSVVFFYQVYTNWIKSSKDYLTKEMMNQGMSKYQAEKLYIHLCKIMDGFIKPNLLLNMKPSGWRRFISYLQSNS